MRNLIPLLLLLLCFTSAPAPAASEAKWMSIEKACPVDGTKSVFLVPSGALPPPAALESRFDILFAPFSDPNAWYQCPSCGFACYMDHFRPMDEKLVKNAYLALTQLSPPSAELSYNMIPISERLDRAEILYRAIGKDSDKDLLCRLQRLKGFFHEKQGEADKARECRQKALDLATALSKDPAKGGFLKEYLAIMGAMNQRLGNNQVALDLLEKADGLRYKNPQYRDEQNAEYNKTLTDAIGDIRSKIQQIDREKKEKP